MGTNGYREVRIPLDARSHSPLELQFEVQRPQPTGRPRCFLGGRSTTSQYVGWMSWHRAGFWLVWVGICWDDMIWCCLVEQVKDTHQDSLQWYYCTFYTWGQGWIRHSFAHLRPLILSADWSISRLQSWTCLSLTTVAEFVKLTQSIVVEIQRLSADLYSQSPTLQSTIFCGVHSGLRGKGIRVSPAW